MTSSRLEQWRAHLQLAGLAGVLVQAGVLVSLGMLRIPAARLHCSGLRPYMMMALAAAALAIRWSAARAFHAALDGRHVRLGMPTPGSVAVSRDCPWHALVVLHIRLNRCGFDQVSL
ncbi:hypothetical protein ACS0X5_18165 [Burkholderia gladioli]|uniref:hypothetical protein n=1 Tax=Burkholderia gladioli TaxID=28095 RepID=UPI00163EDCE8|nr:hypothetical protein [Burkholderia gladioli]CAG9217928.1 conserved hypothetical protein [Burkholderia gladioli]